MIGLSDGLTVPFALAAGLSSVVESTGTVLTVSGIGVAAGAVAMGLGGYIAGREEGGHRDSGKHSAPMHETREGLSRLGLSDQTIDVIFDEMAEDKEKWDGFVTKFDLDPGQQAPKRGLNIAGFYILGGLVPLSPFFLASSPTEGLRWSAVLTTACLFLFGYFKSKLTGNQPLAGAVRTTLVGVLAAAAAFFIARIFAGS